MILQLVGVSQGLTLLQKRKHSCDFYTMSNTDCGRIAGVTLRRHNETVLINLNITRLITRLSCDLFFFVVGNVTSQTSSDWRSIAIIIVGYL